MIKLTQSQAATLYNVARKWLTLSSLAACCFTFAVNAPFGRFSPRGGNAFLFDGIKSWIFMELFSPVSFFFTFITSPLSYYSPRIPSLTSPQTLLAGLFLIHYANRTLVSPLRTPSRSKSHLIVPVAGIIFNIVNGYLMGSYLSSPYARIFLSPSYTYTRPSFYIGLGLWALGFTGNILHDEILLDIRRKAKSKGKGKAEDTDADATENEKIKTERVQQEHYAIPQGWLYDYISFPNYLCEWVEWFGFALAAAPFPITTSSLSWTNLLSVFDKSLIFDPAYLFAPNLAPPYIFFIAEVLLMFPRAYRGHYWYKKRFQDSYPVERKIIIPFLI